MFLEFYRTSRAQLAYNSYTITEHSNHGLANTKAKLQSTKLTKSRPWEREMDLMDVTEKSEIPESETREKVGEFLKSIVENHGIICKIKVFEYPGSEI